MSEEKKEQEIIDEIAKKLWPVDSAGHRIEHILERIGELRKENATLRLLQRGAIESSRAEAVKRLEQASEKYKRECSEQSVEILLKGAEADEAIGLWHLIAYSSGCCKAADWVIAWCQKKREDIARRGPGTDTETAEDVLSKLIDAVFEAVDEGYIG